MINHIFKKNNDVFETIFLFIVTVLFNYFTQGFVKQVFFIGLITLFIFSKKNYFWFAYLFILFMEPATLLSGDTIDASKLLPSFGLGFLNFTVIDLFSIVALIKGLASKRENVNYFFKPLGLLLILLVINFVVSIIRDALNVSAIIDYFRLFVEYSLFFSVGVLLKNKVDLFKFGKSLYFLLIVILMSQIFTITTGTFFISYFAESNLHDFYRASGLKGIDVYIIQLFLMVDILEKKTKPIWYPKVLLVLSYVIFILSATRIWMFVSAITILGYQLYVLRKGFKIVKSLSYITLLMLLLYLFVPPFQKAADMTIFRFEELEKVGKGDTEAEGGGRIYERLPRSLEVINENPYFGSGFSTKFQELLDPDIPSIYGDYHVGNFSLIANIGIVGYLFFVFFWIRTFKLLFNYIKLYNIMLGKTIMKAFILFYFGLLFLHHTSYQIFGFTIHGRIAFSLAIFFALINAYITDRPSVQKSTLIYGK